MAANRLPDGPMGQKIAQTVCDFWPIVRWRPELFSVQLAPGVEVVPIQNGVENEEITSFRLSAPHRIGREQEHVTVP